MHIDRNAVHTDIPALDNQHEKYFQAVERLNDICDSGAPKTDDVKAVLNNILDYAVDNFDTEELLMETEGYELLAQHRTKHETFKDKLDEYFEELDSGSDLDRLSKRMNHLLVEWFTNQIQDDDMKLADFLKQRKQNHSRRAG